MMSADSFAKLAQTITDARDQGLGGLRLKKFDFNAIKEVIKNERFMFDH